MDNEIPSAGLEEQFLAIFWAVSISSFIYIYFMLLLLLLSLARMWDEVVISPLLYADHTIIFCGTKR